MRRRPFGGRGLVPRSANWGLTPSAALASCACPSCCPPLGPRLPWAVWALLVLATPVALAQPPAPLTRGTYLAADGKAAPIEWQPTGLTATDTGEALRLEVEPKAKGTADSAPLTLAPLRLYTITMTCRRGPGLGLLVWVRWVGAEGKAGARQMVWQLPDRWRINWFPLSPLRNTYAQRFCLPPGAREVYLQIALTGHPDTGYNYFDLYELIIARGAEVPFGTRLGPNLLPVGDMETVADSGMALGWSFWGADPGAKVLEKDAQDRPAHSGRRFLSFPAGKNCTLAGGIAPVQSGRAYRLSLWARGTGDIGFGAQSLEETQGQRVDDAQVTHVHVEAADWQEFSAIWFAAGLYTVSANPFMGIGPRTDLDLDDVMLQLIEP